MPASSRRRRHVIVPICGSGQLVSAILVSMYVTRVPNRGSPPAVLLRESYRQAGKVKTPTLANLTAGPDAKGDALSRELKGQQPAARLAGARATTPRVPDG